MAAIYGCCTQLNMWFECLFDGERSGHETQLLCSVQKPHSSRLFLGLGKDKIGANQDFAERIPCFRLPDGCVDFYLQVGVVQLRTLRDRLKSCRVATGKRAE